MEQLAAYRMKKAAERDARTDRIQKRLQQIRDKSATVAYNNSAQYGAVGVVTDSTLKDSTNRRMVSDSSVAKNGLSSRAKLVARRLKQHSTQDNAADGGKTTTGGDKTSGGLSS